MDEDEIEVAACVLVEDVSTLGKLSFKWLTITNMMFTGDISVD